MPWQAGMSELTTALGLALSAGLDDRPTVRRQVVAWYHAQMQSLEGIKPPCIGDDADKLHWMLYAVHLGNRLSGSTRSPMMNDRTRALPLHTQLDERQARYIVKTLKNTATNVGVGATIYR